MIRIAVQIVDTGDACNVGGPVIVKVRTFDIEHTEMEKLLADKSKWRDSFVCGAEVIAKQEEQS